MGTLSRHAWRKIDCLEKLRVEILAKMTFSEDSLIKPLYKSCKSSRESKDKCPNWDGKSCPYGLKAPKINHGSLAEIRDMALFLKLLFDTTNPKDLNKPVAEKILEWEPLLSFKSFHNWFEARDRENPLKSDRVLNGLIELIDKLDLNTDYKDIKSQQSNCETSLENIILYGPPGSGKTYIANELSGGLNTTVVQFHPSYSYEYFIQGERLIVLNNERFTQIIDGPLMIAYRKAQGVAANSKAFISCVNSETCSVQLPTGFLRRYNFEMGEALELRIEGLFDSKWISGKVVSGDTVRILDVIPEDAQSKILEIRIKGLNWGELKTHTILIDEINRADTAKVFGELLNAIAGKDSEKQQPVQLQYSGEKIVWPKNLRIIATMNSADRSIGEIDQALKRRFRIKKTPSDPKLLASLGSEVDVFSRLKDSIEYQLEDSIVDQLADNLKFLSSSPDQVINIYNFIGSTHQEGIDDFFYLQLLSKSLEDLHNAILVEEHALFGAEKKLIGHSFFIGFSKALAVLLIKKFTDGVISSLDSAIDLSSAVEETFYEVLDYEVYPQIESICMGNDQLAKRIFDNWKKKIAYKPDSVDEADNVESEAS